MSESPDRTRARCPRSPRLLDYQGPRHHARRDRRRHRHDDLGLGLPRRNGPVRRGAHRPRRGADPVAPVQPDPVLGHHHRSTTFGTTMADFADRSLGIGYTGGSALLLACLAAVLGLWYASERTIAVDTVSTPRVEAFYWAAITFSQTLGTALGDWLADTGGLGYDGGALVFGAALWSSSSCITGRRSRGCCCSGQPSSSRAPSERRSAISSTSPWRTAA